ncbi:MAG: hypothetical protein ACU0CA_17020 [Paracoccaceae bacterium]
MTLAAFRTANKNCWEYLWKPQSFFVLLLSFSVLIGQVLPMQAAHLMLAESGWVEICGGEDGSYLIKSDQNGEGSEQGHDCNDCSLCTVSANGMNAVPATGGEMFQLSVFANVVFPQDYAFLTDCPEKNWSTSRAPPHKSTKRMPILRKSFSLNLLHSEYSEGASTCRAALYDT